MKRNPILALLWLGGSLICPQVIFAELQSVQWSQDGSRMLVVLSDEMRLFDATGKELRQVALEHSHQWIGLSPDGVHVACLTNDRQAWIHDLNAGSKIQIFAQANASQFASNLSWSPDGKLLSYSIVEVSIESATSKVLGSKTSLYTVNADGSNKKLILTIQSK